eukprot:sb/3473140/
MVTLCIHGTSKQPIRSRYLGHVTGYQPIRDQYFLVLTLLPDRYSSRENIYIGLTVYNYRLPFLMNARLGCSIIVRITDGTASDPVIISQTARDIIIRPVEFRNDLSLKQYTGNGRRTLVLTDSISKPKDDLDPGVEEGEPREGENIIRIYFDNTY